MPLKNNRVEEIAEQIHKVYCNHYREIKGREYWTRGDYSLLDEDVKEADRYIAGFVIENYVPESWKPILTYTYPLW